MGDSGIYTNLVDYTKWLREISNPTLVSSYNFFSGLSTGAAIRDDLRYSLGWSVSNVGGRLQLEHRGTLNGFRTYVIGFPEEESWLVLFSNNADADRAVLINEVLKKYASVAAFEPKTVSGF